VLELSRNGEYMLRTVPVRQYGLRITTKADRTRARTKAAYEWRGYHGTRRPRHDDEIMIAWVCRVARRREGAIPVNLKDAIWQLNSDDIFDRWNYRQTVIIEVIVPETEAQREILSRVTEVRGSEYSFAEPV